MSYNSTVYKVMLASPGDVQAERSLAREIVHEWNSINSESQGVVLLPVGWETHSVPEMGDHPQAIINNQLLSTADVLVGIFWTRVGTPTKDFPSGSVEEIERHMETGKPTMLYFSSAPVVPDSIDASQYAALQAFKTSCKNRGLYEGYADLSEFRSKFTRQLAQKLIQSDYFKVNQAANNAPLLADVPNRLSKDAEDILQKCAQADGTVLFLRHLGGTDLQAGSYNFITDQSPRSTARWTAAKDELVYARYIADAGYKGEVFRITNEGYKYFDLYLK